MNSYNRRTFPTRVLSLILLAAGSALAQAPLLCPPPTGPCAAVHFHVKMYRPETRGFIEFYGINDFSTQAECERARDAAAKHDADVAAFLKMPAGEVGPCHCDTADLNDVARNAQLRLLGDARLRVRERLRDAGAPATLLLVTPSVSEGLGWSGGAPPTPPGPSLTLGVTQPLKMPAASAPSMSLIDLPLIDVQAPPPPAADETFITVENDRIQKILAASAAITDDALRVKVLEACAKRLQVLSNLRALMKGKLADAARAAQSESDRLALVTKLFGDAAAAHWAPKDARDAVIELVPDAEAVLRDANAPPAAKRAALYAFLASAALTDEQQSWIAPIVEGLLQ